MSETSSAAPRSRAAFAFASCAAAVLRSLLRLTYSLHHHCCSSAHLSHSLLSWLSPVNRIGRIAASCHLRLSSEAAGHLSRGSL